MGCDLGLSKSTRWPGELLRRSKKICTPALVGCPMQPAVQVEVPSNRKQLRSYLSGA